jgi:uncharacterized protein
VTRRSFLWKIPAAAFSVPAYAHFVEAPWLEKRHHRIALPGLDPARPIRMAAMADFHVSSFVPLSLVEDAVEMGLAAKPDLICLPGDFITDAEAFNQPRYRAALRRLSSAAPSFATLGNHDGGIWSLEIGGFKDTTFVRRLLSESGIDLIHNAVRVVTVRGRRLQLVGVGDLWNKEVDGERAFANADPRLPTVLLAHNPDSKDVLARYPWQLMISGHTHGGQILVPVVGTRFVPVKDKRYIAGLKPWNGRQVYVTRGVGSIGGIRLNCRPEVTVLDLAG